MKFKKMQTPKKIETLLIDGTPQGLRYHDLANWNGRIFIAPRTSFNDLLKRSELAKSGIYILVGEDEKTNRQKVYIGEADVLSKRLYSHLNKDFWNKVIVVVSKDESLDKASVRYIESVLIKKTKEDKWCDMENGNEPIIKKLSEANVAVMDEFIENIKFMLSTLGYRLIQYQLGGSKVNNENVLYCKGPDTDARGIEIPDGFKIFKDSILRMRTVVNFDKLYDKLLENGVIKRLGVEDKSCILTQDYIFSSPSSASGFVLGRSSNGRYEWKNKDRIPLKLLQDKMIG